MDAIAQSTLDALALYDGQSATKLYENALRQACALEPPFLSEPQNAIDYSDSFKLRLHQEWFTSRYLRITSMAMRAMEIALPFIDSEKKDGFAAEIPNCLRHHRAASMLFANMFGFLPSEETESLLSQGSRQDALSKLAQAHIHRIVNRIELRLLRMAIDQRSFVVNGAPHTVLEGIDFLIADVVRYISVTTSVLGLEFQRDLGNEVRQSMARQVGDSNEVLRIGFELSDSRSARNHNPQ